MKTYWAIVGVFVFGAVIPALSWWWTFFSLSGLSEPHPAMWLGVAFAGYITHAFFSTARHRTRAHWAFFIFATLVGITYELWFDPAERLVGLITYRFESTPTPGTLGGYEVTTTVTPMVTGTVMGLLLFGTTRSVQVLVTTVVASLVCGLLLLPTAGFSCVIWNSAVSISMYTWSCKYPPPRPARAPLRCAQCGYSLLGLAPNSLCPECGAPTDP